MGIKAFVEGGLASVVAGCSTHPLDLIKVRMQLQGEATPNLQVHPHPGPAIAFAVKGSAQFNRPFTSVAVATATHAASHRGPIAIAVEIVRSEGVQAL
ncbi:hypothetical protein L7F22_051258 [Adiantum nelumboides]|nr:hypothetical protein [Adiantum nelumboides]